MNVGHDLCGRLRRSGLLVVVVVLASAGVALAASNAVKGASYTGTYKGTTGQSISFKVSANGKKVTDLSASTPFKCSGGCGGVPSASGGTASISKKGKFKAKLKLLGPGGSTKSEGTETITGAFLKGGAAKGTVTSHFNSGSAGETVTWTATSSG